MSTVESSIVHRFLPYASELYDEANFNYEDLFVNQPAPLPIISIVLGVIFSVLTFMSFQNRLRRTLRDLKEGYDVADTLWGSIFTRTFLLSLLDNNDTNFTVSYNFCLGFLLLGAYQLHYETTYSVMLISFAAVALADLFVVWLAYSRYGSLRDLVVTAKVAEKTEEQEFYDISEVNQASVAITPGNIYQNMTRMMLMVFVVFIGQGVLVGFLVFDIFQNTRQVTCFVDGGPNCPTVGTWGSWLLYVLGMFMQCVLVLSSANGFGQSQTNPVYWLTVLLGSKNKGTFSWTAAQGLGPLKTVDNEIVAGRNSLYTRLALTSFANGFGYRILFNSLPILLAGRPNYTFVIFVPISVLYIAKLDDSHADTVFHLNELPIEDENTRGNVSVSANLKDLSIGMLINNVYNKGKKDTGRSAI